MIRENASKVDEVLIPPKQSRPGVRKTRVLAPKRSSGAALEIRSVFISDVHLGNQFARAEPLLRFLNRYTPEHLYLVGDFVDGWCLERKWYWPDTYDRIVTRLKTMARAGTSICYTPGNHDDFLRNFRFNQPLVQIQDEFIHVCADGRRLVILHGDQFDDVERSNRWLSKLGSILYELMLYVDRRLNAYLARISSRRIPISKFLKQTVKKLVQYVSGFECRVVAHAKQQGCDGAVCGHIHVPKNTILDGIIYVNLGDWMENCTALVEYTDGRLELLDLEADLMRSPSIQPPRPRIKEPEGLSPSDPPCGSPVGLALRSMVERFSNY